MSALTPDECAEVEMSEETFSAPMVIGQLVIEDGCSYARYPNRSLGPVVFSYGTSWDSTASELRLMDGTAVPEGGWFEASPAGLFRLTAQQRILLGEDLARRVEDCLSRGGSIDEFAAISPAGNVTVIDPPNT